MNRNPDCRDGKHLACAGDAWDEWLDMPCECGCECHDEAREMDVE